MATLKAPKTISKRRELRKDAATSVFVRAQESFYTHRSLFVGLGAGIVAIVLGILGYSYVQGARADQAEEILGGIILHYEREDFRVALDGSGEDIGLLDIIDQYGSTPAGNMARFYAADALFRLREYDKALALFEDFDGGGDIVGASVLAGQAAIYEMKAAFDRAGDLFRRAANAEDNRLLSPEYLKSAARAYESAGQYSDAEAALLMIRERYPDSALEEELDFHLGRVRARMN